MKTRRVGMYALLTAGLVGACDDGPAETGAYFFVDHLDEATATYDRNQFASVHKYPRFSDSITLKEDTRRALVPPLTSRFRFEVGLRDSPKLRFAVGAATLRNEPELPFPVSFEIVLDGGEKEEVVYSHLVRRPRANEWRDEEIDLSRWAGRRVGLSFVTRANAADASPVRPFWGHPALYQGRRGSSKPDLILISIDTLRSDHVGAYGYGKDTTPNLDRLSREGVVYEQAASTSSWTLPSHMSMLTGLAPSVHGVVSRNHKLGKETLYLPELLARAGYETRAVVTWWFVSRLFGFERGFHAFRLREQAPAENVVDLALEALGSASSQSQFLFLHFLDAHWPYVPPPEFRERFGPPGDISSLNELVGEGRPPTGTEQVEELLQLYDGEIAYVDRELGRFFDGLKRRGLYESSLIIVTADHGEAFHEHGRWEHGDSLYEEVLRVPLIVKWPGSQAVGRVTTPVSLTSLFRTFLDAAALSVEAPGTVPGLREYVGRNATAKEMPIASELSWAPLGRRGTWPPPGVTMMRSFRSGNWKYIATLGEDGGLVHQELYDLAADPGELQDRSAGAPTEIARFQELLRAHVQIAKSLDSAEEGVEIEPETQRLLESLGYLSH
ncbi:MAG TPA: sulfatase [Vicinamibacteria bacterium]|nr:sulfatase [Vicinamibacteria bacterium]